MSAGTGGGAGCWAWLGTGNTTFFWALAFSLAVTSSFRVVLLYFKNLKCSRKRSNSLLSFTTYICKIEYIVHIFLKKCQTCTLFGLIYLIFNCWLFAHYLCQNKITEHCLKLLNFWRTRCSLRFILMSINTKLLVIIRSLFITQKIKRKVKILSITEHSRMHTISYLMFKFNI